jgi:hypothetical protein
MPGLLALTFLAGCIVGAAINDLARWRRQRNAAQNLLRALDSGTVYYGHSVPVDQKPSDQG